VCVAELLDAAAERRVSLKSYIKPTRHPAFTRFNVFLRDRFQCQYCGSPDDLTFDHVIPRCWRRGHDLGKRRRRLLSLQPAARARMLPAQAGDVADADAVSADRPGLAQQWAALPTEPSARKLDGLSLLGYRVAAVGRSYTSFDGAVSGRRKS
jgi:hypothetical protein